MNLIKKIKLKKILKEKIYLRVKLIKVTFKIKKI